MKQAGRGDFQGAREVARFEMQLALRQPQPAAAGISLYRGPLADAVAAFMRGLPEQERGMAMSRIDDFIDYVLDGIQNSVERTLLLLEFCHRNPAMSLDEVAREFSDWRGLKRGAEDRRQWIVNHLRSMREAGVTLPPAMAAQLETEGEACYEFNEIALARGWDFPRAWKDFKARQEIDASYGCIDEADGRENPGVDAEALDYGMIGAAQVVLETNRVPDFEAEIDLYLMGRELSPALRGLMEEMHGARPADGYRPIAWHNVFWNIPSEFEELPLDLETRDPLCDADQRLADHIALQYPEVARPSRVTVFRRRTALYKACRKLIVDRLLSWTTAGGPARRAGSGS